MMAPKSTYGFLHFMIALQLYKAEEKFPPSAA
jgi:hypothetical protein